MTMSCRVNRLQQKVAKVAVTVGIDVDVVD